MTHPLTHFLGAEAVAAMHERFVASVDRRLDKALQAGALDAACPPMQREALRGFLIEAIRRGHAPSPATLQELAQLSPDALQRAAESIPQPFPARDLKELAAGLARRTPEDFYPQLFGDADRLYTPVQSAADSATERAVAAAIAPHGYSIADYLAGQATDSTGKQRYRIGKLLASLAPDLRSAFEHDPRRSGGLVVCLSRDPMDIARMSTRRGWSSCMKAGDENFAHVPEEVAHGTLIAYLVTPADPLATNPLGRILLKPYEDAAGHRILRAAQAYGLANPDFTATVDALAERLSAQAPEGRYVLRGDAFPDNLSRATLRLETPMSETPAEKILATLGVPVKHRDGRLHVQDLDLSHLGLTELPDLSEVVVHGHFSAASNKLTSLKGLPRHIGRSIDLSRNALTSLQGLQPRVHGDLKVEGNALESLAGAPRNVDGDFSCYNNKLTSLDGGPKWLGGSYDCSGNALTTLRGAPELAPRDFACDRNPQLGSLRGAPFRIGRSLSCRKCGLTTLAGAPGAVGGSLFCDDNSLADFRHGPRTVGANIEAKGNPLTCLAGAPIRFISMRCDLGRFEGAAAISQRQRLLQPGAGGKAPVP